MTNNWFFSCWCFVFLVLNSQCKATELDVFIFGGKGDLAKRYLWNGFFRLFQNNRERKMNFYGLGLSNMPQLDFLKVVNNSVHCEPNSSNNSICKELIQNFVASTNYLQMKNEKDFEKLSCAIDSSINEVIFYLSVPPSAYKHIIQSISSHCDLKKRNKNYKFVFEKPFGESLESAQSLSSLLSKHLNEFQIFRVDHYLGKATTHKILNFRRKNPYIEEILNKKYVEEIQVVVSETIGCKGRTTYYDKSGVIRDMLQNHLTEILCLMTMDVNGEQSKSKLLRDILTVFRRDILFGQYQGYMEEVYHESGNNKSMTPTFAAANIKLKSAKWKNVPVKLISGKRLNERFGYGRIVFKKKYFPEISGCESMDPQIIFMIRNDKLKSPGILVSWNLPFNSDYIPNDWRLASHLDDLTIFGSKGKCFRILIPANKLDAYSYLISKMYEGDHTYFVPVQDLLESWRIWSPVATHQLNTHSEIIQYKIGWSISRILYEGMCESHKCCLLNTFQMKCDLTPRK
uniref:GDH/6PGL endoplasmic bifunctional protein-like isoform X1 n=1 Tax=Styela clava TaxID=7725 RepID=UPI00193A3A73|nr:GDH/6PGL endoplasmic bifunctional protein-like isoform X1 [Styela clava]